MRFICLCLSISILIELSGFCQALQEREWPQVDLNFHLLDVDDGLAHNAVNSLAQDTLGYIWIATQDGVSRFNGKNFENYRNNLNLSEATLANNYVEQLWMDQGILLWMATDGGLTTYDLIKDGWVTDKLSGEYEKSSVSTLLKDKTGRWFLGLYGNGLLIREPNGSDTLLKEDSSNPFSIHSNFISSLLLQGDSVLWIGSYDAGLSRMDLKSKKSAKISLNVNGQLVERVNVLFPDHEGNIWIGSHLGLHVVTSPGDTLHLAQSSRSGEGLSDIDVLCLEEDQFGRLWLGTRNGGLNILDPAQFLLNPSSPIVNWYLPQSDGSSVFNRTVSALLLDRNNNMWIGTSTGVNVVKPGGEPVKWVQRNPGNENSISHNRIGALAISSSGNIWAGTDGGGIDLYHQKSGKLKNFSHQKGVPNSLSNDFVISILEDSKGRLWAGTYRGGINLWEGKGEYFNYFLQGEPKDGSDVRAIFESKDQTIWVGTNQGGLYRYDEETHRFMFVEALSKSDIRGISEDRGENLWIATYGNGVIKYDPKSGITKHYDAKNYPQLKENIFFSILCLEEGSVLAGSRYGGLIWIDPETDSISQITEEDGLSNNTINSMMRGGDGVVWMGTFKGISYFDPKDNRIGNLNTLENIQGGEFYTGSIAIGQNGEVYFGGNKGLTIVDVQQLGKEQPSYPLWFEYFSVSNQRKGVDGESLDSALAFKQTLHINHDISLFSFEFNLLKLPFVHQVQYAYLLEGYQDQWVDVNEAGVANLSRIPPGKYTLRIRAITGNGIESSNSLVIIIPPPFWQTWPAYMLYAILIFGVGIGFLRYYSERIKLKNSLVLERRKRQLEKGVNEERIRFFTNFSHELKTPLTLIITPLEELANSLREGPYNKKLKIVLRNAKFLHHLIGDLLEFRKAETGTGQLHIGGHDLVHGLKKWVNNHKPVAKKKGIELKLIPFNTPCIMANFDVDKLQIVINNLLSNATKYCREGDRVEVGYAESATEHCIIVQDSGPGTPKEEFPKLFEWFYRVDDKTTKEGTGIGLALAKRLMELHGGGIRAMISPLGGLSFEVYWPLDLPVELVEEEDGEQTPDLKVQASNGQATLQDKEEAEKEVLLIVDDNEDIVEYLEEVFTPEYEILKARDGFSGFQVAINHVPDLIISDVMMPGKDGLDLCGALKSHFATTHIPIILLTAKDSTSSVQEGYKEGADEYMVKPFHTPLLKVRVENLLENRRMLRKYFTQQQIEQDNTSMAQEIDSLVKTEQGFLQKFNEIIIAQMKKGSTQVEDLAKEIGMSRTSLYRKIKALTGESINEYLRKQKIEHAARLIELYGYTISEAAFEVGFSDLKYFRKVFKELFGKLPSDFKKQP